jgi:hypothetical protein
MCVSALAFLATGMLVRDAPLTARPFRSAAFGGVVGLMCLAKTAMFVAAPAFLLAAAWNGRPFRRTLAGVAIAATLWLFVTGPFVAALSVTRGRLTIGDSGALNYAWLVNPTRRFVPDEHWQGASEGNGTAIHPTRRIWTKPDVFEFAGPIRGTYPPWTDPSYWYEGLTLHFNSAAEWNTVQTNSLVYFDMFGLTAIALVVVAFCLGGGASLRAAATHHGNLLVLAAWGLGTYLVATNLAVSNIATQPSTRFVAPFVVIAFGAMLSGLSLPETTGTILGRFVLLATILMGGSLAIATAEHIRALEEEQPVALAVATRLQELGLRPGDGVAILGRRYDRDHDHEFWARLAHLEIVSHVPDAVGAFRLSPDRWGELEAVLASTGARALVYKAPDGKRPGPAWHSLDSGFYVLLFRDGYDAVTEGA